MKMLKTRSYLGLVVIVLLFAAVNIVATGLFRGVRLDLTEEKLYTLSQGSKSILKNIQDPITMKYYFSATDTASIPGIKAYGDRVLDLLNNYARQSEVLHLETYDTRPDTEEAEWAEKYGLSGLQSNTGEILYFGLVLQNELGDEEIIPFFDIQRESFLEYDITKALVTLTRSEKPVLGIYSSLPLSGAAASPFMPAPGSTDPWYFTMDLEKIYDMQTLENLESIPNEINLLLVMHPKSLTEQEQYSLDQYILQGRSIMILVDPFCEADNPPPNPGNPMAAMQASRASSLPKVLTHNGFSMDTTRVVLDRALATPVQMGPGQTSDYYAWLTLTSGQMNQEDVVSAQLENILLPFTGSFTFDSEKGKEVQVFNLLSSSPAASTESSQVLMFGGSPERLTQNYEPGEKSKVLSYRITGSMQSAFPDGAPELENNPKEAPEEKKGEASSHQNKNKEPCNVIIAADVDFLQNRFSLNAMDFFGNTLVTPLNNNVHFLYNSLESLAGSTELIAIRSRGKFTRPFIKVAEIDARAEAKWLAEEKALSQKVDEANQKISSLLQREGNNPVVADQTILDEIQKLREEKGETQSRLRKVRKNLRQEKEQLGTFLFLINTFLIPLLILFYGAWHATRGRLRHV